MEEPIKVKRWGWQDPGTAATIGLFLVSGITGMMLFFKIGEGAIKGIHEWLSVAFVIASILHIARNWRPMKRYFKMRSFWGISVVVLLLVIVIAIPAGEGGHGPRGHHPIAQVVDTLSTAKLEALASTMNTTSDALVQKLRSDGLTVQNAQQTVQEVAQTSNRDLLQVLSVVMTKEVPTQAR